MEKLLLSTKDIMDVTGYCRTTVCELLRTHQLDVVRNGRSVRVPRASLEEWIQRKLAATEKQPEPGG